MGLEHWRDIPWWGGGCIGMVFGQSGEGGFDILATGSNWYRDGNIYGDGQWGPTSVVTFK